MEELHNFDQFLSSMKSVNLANKKVFAIFQRCHWAKILPMYIVNHSIFSTHYKYA